MDELELSALDVRYSAATALLKSGEITGMEALRLIVVPSPDALAASVAVARLKPPLPTKQPQKVRGTRRNPRQRTSKPRTFEDLMASYG